MFLNLYLKRYIQFRKKHKMKCAALYIFKQQKQTLLFPHSVFTDVHDLQKLVF